MAKIKPVGFDTYRTFSFVSNDGSGFSFFRKASFSLEDGGHHKLYAGPAIAATSAAVDCVITTSEAHGFKVGQTVVLHGLPSNVSALLNGTQIISAVPTATTFQVGVNTSTAGVTTGIGLVGVDIEARIPVANYACVPGDLCVNDHPEAWEMPLVG